MPGHQYSRIRDLLERASWQGDRPLGGKQIRFDCHILDEYQKTIRKIGAKINPARAETWVQIVTQKTSLLSVTPFRRRWSRDPDDDKFVQCSLEGQADYLVSGDADLVSLQGKMPIKIVTACLQNSFGDIIEVN